MYHPFLEFGCVHRKRQVLCLPRGTAGWGGEGGLCVELIRRADLTLSTPSIHFVLLVFTEVQQQVHSHV